MPPPARYLLDEDGLPRRVDDAAGLIWASWFVGSGRQMALAMSRLADPATGATVLVGTYFTGVDYGYALDGADEALGLHWETIVRGGSHNNFCKRYASAAEAREGHRGLLEWLAQAAAGGDGGR